MIQISHGFSGCQLFRFSAPLQLLKLNELKIYLYVGESTRFNYAKTPMLKWNAGIANSTFKKFAARYMHNVHSPLKSPCSVRRWSIRIIAICITVEMTPEPPGNQKPPGGLSDSFRIFQCTVLSKYGIGPGQSS
jgi:hypothetical protein